jgi:hypothetical protein
MRGAGPPKPATSNYAGCHHHTEAPIDANNTGVLFLNSRVRLDDVTDGLSQTIFAGEKLIEPSDLGWMSGTRATLRNMGTAPASGGLAVGAGLPPLPPEPTGGGFAGPASGEEKDPEKKTTPNAAPANPVGGFSSWHGGVHLLLGDGSVRHAFGLASPVVLSRLGHRADGELIDANEF